MFLEMPFFATSEEQTIKEFMGRAAMEMLLTEDGRGKSVTNLSCYSFCFLSVLTDAQREHLHRIIWSFYEDLTRMLSPEMAALLGVAPLVLNGHGGPPPPGAGPAAGPAAGRGRGRGRGAPGPRPRTRSRSPGNQGRDRARSAN